MSGFSRRAFVAAAAVAVFYGGRASAQSESAGGKRVALKGYDPMSYFTEGKPEKGTGEFTFAFDDATYWFKSAEHKAKFAAEPEHYAPQFDGYCAMQLSRGYKVEADPEAWTIVEGKLYLNYSQGVKKTWSEARSKYIDQAEKNWPALHK